MWNGAPLTVGVIKEGPPPSNESVEIKFAKVNVTRHKEPNQYVYMWVVITLQKYLETLISAHLSRRDAPPRPPRAPRRSFALERPISPAAGSIQNHQLAFSSLLPIPLKANQHLEEATMTGVKPRRLKIQETLGFSLQRLRLALCTAREDNALARGNTKRLKFWRRLILTYPVFV
ncbi:hypothetical protein EVAR_25999_1 [Eumeta japonica]|uniref:Uncharacterized protein n=1 Tax=Eumeta variegata TaxID=151549 RepID=A0A4C1V1G4_EUMVA|nr:hypothetical protein EVAR_25999_1 [Eumeta japonica]